jgi:hypothetical protein
VHVPFYIELCKLVVSVQRPDIVSTFGRVAIPKPALPNGAIKYVAHQAQNEAVV